MNGKQIRMGLIAMAFITVVVCAWILIDGKGQDEVEATEISKYKATGNTLSGGKDEAIGSMSLGKFTGQVVYEEEEDYYFLELKGARFPFKTSLRNILGGDGSIAPG